MNHPILFIISFIQQITSTILECSTFSSKVSIMPHTPSLPHLHSSPILVNWSLISPDPLCLDPPRKPRFHRWALGEVSAIFHCEECPRCSVLLPDAFEVPIGTKINSIFILGQWIPHNKARSDIPVFYLEMKKKLIDPLRNCRLLLPNTSRFDGTIVSSLMAPVILLISVFIFLIILRYCCCKPSRKREYNSSYGWE